MKLAIIPARSGSTRIVNKNIVDFNGHPLIYYPLKAAQEANIFDEIHVSTDSEYYAEIVRGLGFEVSFLRAPELGKNDIGIADVLRWVVSEYERRGANVSQVCSITATAPLIDAGDIVRAKEIFEEYGETKPVLAVTSFPAPIEQSLVVGDDGALRAVFPDKFFLPSQQLMKTYQDAGSIFYIGRSLLMEQEVPAYSDCYPLVLPREKVIDIDEYEDLAVAKALYLGRLHTLSSPD